jgi:hypothetical protein
MKFNNLPVWLALLAASNLFVACSEEPSVQKYRVSKASNPEPPAVASVGSSGAVDMGLPFTWVLPAGWQEGKASSMRLASYNVPLSNGEIGDFSLVQLGGAAGGVMANINRWRGQIGLGSVEAEGLADSAHMHTTQQGQQFLHVTLINEANPDGAILGGIFQQQDYVLFAKLNVTLAGVEEAQESFEAFCNSIVFKDL